MAKSKLQKKKWIFYFPPLFFPRYVVLNSSLEDLITNMSQYLT